MNHSEAIESQAVAAYLLGDLAGAQREAFEVHCIDCPICAKDVWNGTRMLAAGREALKSEPAKVLQFRPLKWINAHAVAAVLAVVVGIQGYLIRTAPALQSLEVPAQGPIFRSATRAEGEPVKVIQFQGDQPVVSYVDIPQDRPFPTYRLEIRAASGKVLSHDVSEEQARSAEYSVPLSVRPLPADRYVLAVVGVREDGNRSELARWNFVVQ